MLYDLAIIGGGPAGVGAGVYAARKKIKTVFITESFVSQSTVSDNIQNWIGTVSIKGEDLTALLEKHLRAYAGEIVDIKIKEKAIALQKMVKFLLSKLTNQNIKQKLCSSQQEASAKITIKVRTNLITRVLVIVPPVMPRFLPIWMLQSWAEAILLLNRLRNSLHMQRALRSSSAVNSELISRSPFKSPR